MTKGIFLVICMYMATVTSKGMITIPKEVRRKLKLKKGMKVMFVETEKGVLMIPIKPLEESFGDGGKKMLEVAAEISEERRREEEHDRSEL